MMLSTSPAAYELSWLAAHLPTADRLAQLLDGDPITALLRLVRQRAPVTIGFAQPSPELFANPELARQFAIAKAAAAKLQSTWNPALTDEEIQALHALVHLVTRPSLRILSGQVPGELVEWPEIDETRSVIGSRLPGIGRLDTAAREAVGTGWFIAPSVLVTNNHVLAQLCGIDVHRDVDWRARLDETWPQQVERWRKDPQARPVWDPADSPGATADVGRIVGVRGAHPDVDLALLEVEGITDSAQRVLPIAKDPPATLPGERVYLVGYPGVQHSGLHPALTKLLFGAPGTNTHKRLAPGILTGTGARLLTHDATTLAGSSGSPVIAWSGRQRVIGLHFKGQYGVKNFSIPFWQLAGDPFFTAAGIALGASHA